MVKNKRLLYALLPAVLVIWGLIFQRIWSAAQDGDEPATEAVAAAVARVEPAVAAHPPPLLLTYADPFRASSPAAEPRAVEAVVRSTGPASDGRPLAPASLNLSTAPPTVAVVPVTWPLVKYLGFINNPRLDSRIALLAIDEKETPLKLGENHQGLWVTKIWRDSVQLVFKGYRKTVIRNAIN